MRRSLESGVVAVFMLVAVAPPATAEVAPDIEQQLYHEFANTLSPEPMVRDVVLHSLQQVVAALDPVERQAFNGEVHAAMEALGQLASCSAVGSLQWDCVVHVARLHRPDGYIAIRGFPGLSREPMVAPYGLGLVANVNTAMSFPAIQDGELQFYLPGYTLMCVSGNPNGCAP